MLDYINLQYIRYRTLIAYLSGDWKDIKIVESGQPLVRVPDDIAFPYYAKILKLANDENIFFGMMYCGSSWMSGAC